MSKIQNGAQLLSVLSALALSSPLTASGDTTPVAIPTGIPQGRPDAKYGTYESRYANEPRRYQEVLLQLENYAHGLGAAGNESEATLAGREYLLERHVIDAILAVANAPARALTPNEREALLYQAVQVLRTTRTYSERLFESMVRLIDISHPGPNGLQIPTGETAFLPNYRSDTELTPEQAKAAYAKKLGEFEAGGGTLAEAFTFNPENLGKRPGITKLEYVVRLDGTIRATAGRMGHILLAEGEAVLGAGQFVILSDKRGNPVAVVASNASGSYKPDLLTAQRVGEDACIMLGLSPETSLIVTKGEPASTQTVKLLMKSRGEPKERIQAEVDRLDRTKLARARITRLRSVKPRAL